MWMSVLLATIAVTTVQLATTIRGVTPALATVDMQGTGYFAQVSASIYPIRVAI